MAEEAPASGHPQFPEGWGHDAVQFSAQEPPAGGLTFWGSFQRATHAVSGYYRLGQTAVSALATAQGRRDFADAVMPKSLSAEESDALQQGLMESAFANARVATAHTQGLVAREWPDLAQDVGWQPPHGLDLNSLVPLQREVGEHSDVKPGRWYMRRGGEYEESVLITGPADAEGRFPAVDKNLHQCSVEHTDLKLCVSDTRTCVCDYTKMDVKRCQCDAKLTVTAEDKRHASNAIEFDRERLAWASNAGFFGAEERADAQPTTSEADWLLGGEAGVGGGVGLLDASWTRHQRAQAAQAAQAAARASVKRGREEGGPST